jgi:hypothetical protein
MGSDCNQKKNKLENHLYFYEVMLCKQIMKKSEETKQN